jgi:hypothetical protein
VYHTKTGSSLDRDDRTIINARETMITSPNTC